MSWTPLHEAANRNYVEIVGYLLDNGADIDPQGGDDLETPLIDAASNGHIDTMKLLIEKGADCKLRDKKVFEKKNNSYEPPGILLEIYADGPGVQGQCPGGGPTKTI